MRLLSISKINRRCRALKHGNNPLNLLNGYFSQQNIKVDFKGLDNIPSKGPFLIVSNHPFGFLDGLILLRLLLKRFPKVKITANFLLKKIETFSEYAIAVNPFEKIGKKSMGGTQKVKDHLNANHPVVLFPAGLVSTTHDGLSKPARDIEWGSSTKNLILNAGVSVIPIFFEGQNSKLFHLAGKIHPVLRTILIPSEFAKIKNRTISCHIGLPFDEELVKEGNAEHLYNLFKKDLKY